MSLANSHITTDHVYIGWEIWHKSLIILMDNCFANQVSLIHSEAVHIFGKLHTKGLKMRIGMLNFPNTAKLLKCE